MPADIPRSKEARDHKPQAAATKDDLPPETNDEQVKAAATQRERLVEALDLIERWPQLISQSLVGFA